MKKEYIEIIQTIDDTASEMEMIEIASSILNNLMNCIGINIETDRDKITFNKISTIVDTLKDIIKEEKK